MKKSRSAVYLCFFVGVCCLFVGVGLIVLGGAVYGAEHPVFRFGEILGIAGFCICWVPFFATLFLLSFERLRIWWRLRRR